MKKTIQTIVMAALCLNFPASAQQKNPPPSSKQGQISGKVISLKTREPLEGAAIQNINTALTLFTDKQGEFPINLPAGRYRLAVFLENYQTEYLEIKMPLKEPLVIELEPKEQNTDHPSLRFQPIPVPLSIGDTLGAIYWNLHLKAINHSAPEYSTTLSRYKGKLIILDFWATWCSSCIANMPRLHGLQEQIGKDLVILPVSNESSDKVSNALKNNSILKTLNLSSVVEDTLFSKLFPHQLVPHYVWIDGTGKVLNITSAEEINLQSVQDALRGQPQHLQQKQDLDTSKPLFTTAALPENQLSLYSLLLKGKYPGLPSGTLYQEKEDTQFGITLTNSSLKYLFQTACSTMVPSSIDKRIVLEGDAATELQEHYDDPNWEKDNLYSYELRLPLHLAKDLYPTMLQQLNQVSGYQGNIEKRSIPCLILNRKGNLLHQSSGQKHSQLDQDGVLHLSSTPILYLRTRLDALLPTLVLDETGYSGSFDLRLTIKNPTLSSIQSELEKQGFKLSLSIRNTEVLVIRKLNQPLLCTSK